VTGGFPSGENSPLDVAPRENAGNEKHGLRQPVSVRQEELTLPTYLPAAPDKHPMFLEKRVYQGSSGRVYPLPFTDRIAEHFVDRKWKAVWIENEFVRVLVLPEIGGRIHAIQDKTNGYDLIYHQHVIKPALVGLAGPWVSGGIEFNWPQHHRPATFLPVDLAVEESADGSKTIWCGDHDPMERMKGMHGVCLHPGRAVVELKARAYNRTPFVHTFLWWVNVATRVHEAYQSFFPPDVYHVADHARRSMSEYPLANGVYYGVNYGERARKGIPPRERPTQFVPPHYRDKSDPPSAGSPVPAYAPNDLSFYANIPTPCSYMCMGSREDFFGGYDFFAQAGIVHVANHHISPGKKQWTWGNHPFGYAWDRNLTEKDSKGEYGPYIEIMAGVFTDNQPDFSFLQPGETRTWSQYWYPIQQIGPAQQANVEAAVSVCRLAGPRHSPRIRIGVSVTRRLKRAQVTLFNRDQALLKRDCDLAPGKPFLEELPLPADLRETDLTLRVSDAEGREIISHSRKPRVRGKVPPPATEPPAPADVVSADELYVTGLHLDQYRHATCCPAIYWREALRRDPGDARCNNALGLWHLRRGEFTLAETYFRKAIERLTTRNANPYDSEPFYNLGLCLRYQADSIDPLGNTRIVGQKPPPSASNQSIRHFINSLPQLLDSAYAAFYKATWNQAWQSAACHALAELDCRRAAWTTALEHLDRSLRLNTDNTRARNLKALVLRRLDRGKDAEGLLRETLALDPLDWWARHLSGEPIEPDLQVCLDLAHDCARAGLYAEAVALLERAAARPRDLPDQSWGAAPLVHYTLGWLHEKTGDRRSAQARYRRGSIEAPDYCFPARLEEIAILDAAIRANPRDARAAYFLGNLLYDRRRHVEAIRLWERSARLDPKFSVVWRNLGIGYFNVSRQAGKAQAAYEKAFHADSRSARVLFECDQLWKRLGKAPARRLQELEKHPDLVRQRDDLSVELCALYNLTGQHDKALALVSSRNFQPWEGGEGAALGQHVSSHLALGREALARGEAASARDHFAAALEAPANLGEAKHLLANQSDIHYCLGLALAALGDKSKAHDHWQMAAISRGDFQQMSVRAFSEMTYYSALARERLGRKASAKKLLNQLLAYALKLQKAKAKLEYFATSLPTMLLFDDDLQFRQETTALFLQAQAHLGLGRRSRGRALLRTVLERDPGHALAAELLAGTASA
jgi:tetratricopeptide (TPR) repeat protein